MEDVKITQKNTILGGVLDEYDVNALRYVLEEYLDTHTKAEHEDHFIDSLEKANVFFKDVIIKSKTVGR